MDNFLSSLNIKILEAGHKLCGSWWNFSNINSPFDRIYYTHEGEGSVVHHDSTYTLYPGSISIIPANTLSHYRCENQMEQFYIHCTIRLVDSVELFQILSSDYQVDVRNEKDRIHQIFKRFMIVYDTDFPGRDLELDGLLRQILSMLCRVVDEEKQAIRLNELGRFQPAFKYIYANLKKRITLEELARTMCLHPTYFSNLFTRKFGISPLGYLKRYRIDQAKSRLWSSNDGLDAIGRSLGFCDAFHFSKAFKKETGISPTDFKAQKGLRI